MGQFMTAYVHIVQGCNILAVAILTVTLSRIILLIAFKMTISDKHMQQHQKTTSLMPLLQELSLC